MTRDDASYADTTYLSAVASKDAELKDVLLETVGTALARHGARGFSILQSTADAADFLIVEDWDGPTAMRAGEQPATLGDARAVIADRTLVASAPDAIRWTRII